MRPYPPCLSATGAGIGNPLGRIGGALNVVFDLGKALIGWDLRARFQHDFETPAARDAYLQRVGFPGWTYRADQSVPWADLTATHGAMAHRATLIRRVTP